MPDSFVITHPSAGGGTGTIIPLCMGFPLLPLSPRVAEDRHRLACKINLNQPNVFSGVLKTGPTNFPRLPHLGSPIAFTYLDKLCS